MSLNYTENDQNVFVEINEKSIDIPYSKENLEKLKELVDLFEYKTIEYKDIFYCALHYKDELNYETTYISWWYCDNEHAQDVYELFCNEYANETTKTFGRMRKDEYQSLIDRQYFADFFDVTHKESYQCFDEEIYDFYLSVDKYRKYINDRNFGAFENFIDYAEEKEISHFPNFSNFSQKIKIL